MNKNPFNNIWFVRLISLVFAVFLYLFVSSENANVPLRVIRNQEYASVNITETISNVPVYLGKTDGETFVSGVPETVDVRLTGPRNIINQVSSETLRVETEDLTNVQPGSRAIRYLVTNLPQDIDYQVTPSRTIVQISRRETVTLPVEYDLGKKVIDKDYFATQVKMTPSEVTLTGNEEVIKQIDRVFINISSDKTHKENFTGTYAIKIVDKLGNLLDVNATVTDIKVEVEVKPIQKDVPINLLSVGEDTANYSYSYEFVGENKAAIATSSPLKFINGKVDATNIKETSILPVQLELTNGLVLIRPKQIEVRVKVTPLGQEIQDGNTESTQPTQGSDSMDEISQDQIESDTELSSSEVTSQEK